MALIILFCVAVPLSNYSLTPWLLYSSVLDFNPRTIPYHTIPYHTIPWSPPTTWLFWHQQVLISSNSTWLVASRHDSTCLTYRTSWDEDVERVEPCCSNMADDEQAIVLSCTSLVVFVLLHTQILFVFQPK